MRITNRVKKLEDARPQCDGRVRRLVGPEYVVTAADRCRLCGGCHVLVIEEVIVTTDPAPAAGSDRGGSACV